MKATDNKIVEIRRSANNKFKEFLRDYASSALLSTNSSFFPWYYKGNKGRKTDSYEESIHLYKDLYSSCKEKIGYGYVIETQEVCSHLYGKQTVIKNIVIKNLDDYIKFISKEKEYNIFLQGLESLKAYFIARSFQLESLYSWIIANLDFMQLEKTSNFYPSLFSSLEWLILHPNSGLYIREIPVEVHTKFIEENEKIISSLYCRIKNFETQLSFEDIFGLKKKEPLIRFRRNDNRNEMALPISSFSTLDRDEDLSNIDKIYVVENEIVYLTFPIKKDSMCVFGSGFQASILSSAKWLNFKRLYYFGDLDEHGFEMLGMFRSFFPKTKSFLMNKQTFLDHIQYTVNGKLAPATYERYLTEEEKDVLEMLRSDIKRNRLEQEKISVKYIFQSLC